MTLEKFTVMLEKGTIVRYRPKEGSTYPYLTRGYLYVLERRETVTPNSVVLIRTDKGDVVLVSFSRLQIIVRA